MKTASSIRGLIVLLCCCVTSFGLYGHAQIRWFSVSVDDSVRDLSLLSTGDGNIDASKASKNLETKQEVRRISAFAGSATETNRGLVYAAAQQQSAESQGAKPLGCFNSESWLKGPRHPNLSHDPLFTEELARQMILDLENLLISNQRHTLLGQSICHADGRFRNDTAAGVSFEERTVRLWAVRLIYYAIHYHQHRLAVPEATQRYDMSNSNCSTTALLQKHNVSVFDYECPNARYIIVPLGGNGLGAHVRGAMVQAFIMGLISDRIVLFVNNAPKGNKYLKGPWLLASCPQRKDYQCFFMPTSPC